MKIKRIAKVMHNSGKTWQHHIKNHSSNTVVLSLLVTTNNSIHL